MDCKNSTACQWDRRSDWIVNGKRPDEWITPTNPKPTITILNTAFNKPCQCVANDCKFVAAVSAVLWMGKNINIKLESLGNSNQYSVVFYDQNNVAKSPLTLYDYMLCDSNKDPKWAFDRTNIRDIWPGLFEKAYAASCQSLEGSINLPVNKPVWPCTDPNGLVPPFGSGFMDRRGTTNNRIIKFSSIVPGASVTTLNQICNTNGKTKYPAISFTKADLTGAPSYLVSDHSYTVLGIYKDISNYTDVVLRNPKCETSSSGPTGPWLYQKLNSGDGILTVPKTTFETYFSGIQYVIPV